MENIELVATRISASCFASVLHCAGSPSLTQICLPRSIAFNAFFRFVCFLAPNVVSFSDSCFAACGDHCPFPCVCLFAGVRASCYRATGRWVTLLHNPICSVDMIVYIVLGSNPWFARTAWCARLFHLMFPFVFTTNAMTCVSAGLSVLFAGFLGKQRRHIMQAHMSETRCLICSVYFACSHSQSHSGLAD